MNKKKWLHYAWSMIKLKSPGQSSGAFLLEGPVAHAARGGDGRQEGRERGYYHLHRNLNDSLFHDSSLFTLHSSLP